MIEEGSLSKCLPRAIFLLAVSISVPAQGAAQSHNVHGEIIPNFVTLYVGILVLQAALIVALLIERRRARRANRKLSDSEDRFARAFKANPQPMSITTLSDGRYVDVNESFLNMSGFTAAEVIGRTSIEVGVFESQAHREAVLLKPLQNGSARNLETSFRKKDGSYRVLLSSLELLEVGNEKCILVASSDITERKETEQRLAELTGLLLRTQDDERRRIARELHDVTAQSVGLIMLNLAQVQKEASSVDERSKDKLQESLTLGEQALKDIRTLSYVLHPPLLDQAGLVTALKWYVKGFSERSGVKVTFSEEGNNGHRMPSEVEYALFRIVQESLTNIRRHTNSETAEIDVKRMPDRVLLSVRDRGKGLKLNLPRNGNGVESIGVGIPGMRHRLLQLGGELLVDSDPNGTTVTATVPVRWDYDSSSLS
jgi:PAS domain S-box-containing protein